MTRSARLSAVLLSLVALLSACSRQPDLTRYIPADATSVISLNTGALGKKIAWSMIKGDNLFKQLQAETGDPKTASAIEGIEDAGVRFSAISYAFTKTDTRFPGNTQVAVLVPLSDAAKWEAYARKVWPGNAVATQGDFKILPVSSEYKAAWTKDLLILTNHALAIPDQYGERRPDEPATMSAIAGLFGLAEKSSIKSVKGFGSLNADDHDLAFWVNSEQAVNQSQDAGFGAAANLTRSLWKDSYTTVSFDFENGRIAIRSASVAGDSLQPILREFASSSVDGDMLDRTSGQNLDAALAFHLSMTGVRTIADKLGLAPFAEQYLQQMGTNMNNVLSALSGDLVVSVNDLRQMTLNGSASPDASFNLGLKIGRKPAFDSLITLLAAQNLIHQGPQGYFIGDPAKPDMVIAIGDKYAALSNRPAVASAWIAGKPAKGLPKAATDALSGHPLGMYADVSAMLAQITPDPSDANGSAVLAESRKVFKDISLYSEKMSGDKVESKVDVRFVDDSRNSLLQLLGFASFVNRHSTSEPEFPVPQDTTLAPADTAAMIP